jgi:hypothetical protein
MNSYRVMLPGTLRFKNDRAPHVESDVQDVLNGTQYTLGKRRVKILQEEGAIAVTYDVDGLTNGDHPAHLTVYFGTYIGEADNF